MVNYYLFKKNFYPWRYLIIRGGADKKKLAYLGFQYLDQPSYSPDLAPSDYHLFSGLKKTIERSPFFVRR